MTTTPCINGWKLLACLPAASFLCCTLTPTPPPHDHTHRAHNTRTHTVPASPVKLAAMRYQQPPRSHAWKPASLCMPPPGAAPGPHQHALRCCWPSDSDQLDACFRLLQRVATGTSNRIVIATHCQKDSDNPRMLMTMQWQAGAMQKMQSRQQREQYFRRKEHDLQQACDDDAVVLQYYAMTALRRRCCCTAVLRVEVCVRLLRYAAGCGVQQAWVQCRRKYITANVNATKGAGMQHQKMAAHAAERRPAKPGPRVLSTAAWASLPCLQQARSLGAGVAGGR